MKNFKEIAKKFYLKFCEVLRVKVNFDNEILNWFSKFIPENVVSGQTNSIVRLLIKIFPNEYNNFDSINTQFRSLADIEVLKDFKNESICNFWARVSEMKNELNELMFLELSRIVGGILSIPHSSANVERIFSYQNIIKTKERNRLHVPTVSGLIQTKDLLRSSNSCCFSFKIPNNLLTKTI